MVGYKIEPEVKMLFFNSYNALKYWLNYITDYFKKNKIYANRFNLSMVVNGVYIKFFVYDGNVSNKLRGYHHVKVYFDMETKLEKNFSEILKEILNG